MRALLIAMAAGIALSGCVTSEQVDKTNLKIQSGLADACPKLEAAHNAFLLSGIFINYPQKVIETERQAYAGVRSICVDPASVTLQSSVTKVLRAIEDIKAAKSGG
ncbi:hypothetical protein [Rhizobium sp. WW_1]|jgi:hypothetical protein|uniref:hypothetical protein n=1 Tax=Rhizobium sp. WW_1 TaxID=1907375 RepID=UPI000647F0B3|nr:hypothetical protein [Rhizobium sp. WW_1]RKD61569.1 hypothetical protein BJ928_107170 [Rhizobium sp. WW_1]